MAEQLTAADAVGLRQAADAAEKNARVTPPRLRPEDVIAKAQAPVAAKPAESAPKAEPPKPPSETDAKLRHLDERMAYLDGEAKRAFAARDEERRRSRELQEKMEAQQAQVYHLSQQLEDARRVRESQELEGLDPSERQVRQVTAYVKGLESQLAQQNEYLRAQAQRIEEMAIEGQLARLEAKYPDMDREFVLAAKLANPNVDLDSLAKRSNDRVAAIEKRGAEKYVEQLKKRSDQTRPVSSTATPSGIAVPKPQIDYGENSHATRRAVANHARQLLDAYQKVPG